MNIQRNENLQLSLPEQQGGLISDFSDYRLLKRQQESSEKINLFEDGIIEEMTKDTAIFESNSDSDGEIEDFIVN